MPERLVYPIGRRKLFSPKNSHFPPLPPELSGKAIKPFHRLFSQTQGTEGFLASWPCPVPRGWEYSHPGSRARKAGQMPVLDHVGWTDRRPQDGAQPSLARQSMSVRRYMAGTDLPIPTKYCALGTAPSSLPRLKPFFHQPAACFSGKT